MAVLGIDLGTTYSVMAVIENGRAVVIPNAEKQELTPSAVSVDVDGHVFVGSAALERAMLDPLAIVRSSKRKMGSAHTYTIHHRSYTPVEIAAYILEKLRRDAQTFLGEVVDEAVITVPAYFSDVARRATLQAAEIAGLRVRRIINEPTAATLAYGLGHTNGERVMVWDLGGGTFDISILEFADGVFEVLATAGDAELGGDDWRDVLQRQIAQAYELPPNASDPQLALQVLQLAEETKKRLSVQERVEVDPAVLGTTYQKIIPARLAISRAQFERWAQPLCGRMLVSARQVLLDAGIGPKDLDRTILVGGATRMPMVRRVVGDFTGQKPYTDIDPDRVVALGAAIQAGMLQGTVKDSVLIDVIPLSLGIETQGGICTRLIERNTRIPVSKDRIFTTAHDNQPEMEIHILQGERELAKYNVSLGRITFTGFALAKKGAVKINVTFSVDVNGVLQVSARDVYTGEQQTVTVQPTGLSRDEIQRLIREAAAHRQRDEDEKQEVLRRIQLSREITGVSADK